MPRPRKPPGKIPNTTLKKLREDRGWTQRYASAQISDPTGTTRVDGKLYGRWEKGESYPQPHHMEKLKEVYGVNTEEELGFAPVSPPPPQPKKLAGEKDERDWMLQRLQNSYEELFAQSLAEVNRIALRLTIRPFAVENTTVYLFQTPMLPERPLPPNTSILQVYEKAGGELLILGAPGAGKSTLLLDLAQQLVEQAESDRNHPLPVILYLSSWAVRRAPLHVWMVDEIAKTYFLSKPQARRLVKEEKLLLLLDGLDEMDEKIRPACIAAINTYHRVHTQLPLVVCSRLIEYEVAAQTQRLVLQNAVVIQPLKKEQIKRYLVQGGDELASLRDAVASNPVLAELAAAPLMLHVLVLAYKGSIIGELPTQEDQLRQKIWTDYFARMVTYKGQRGPKGRGRRYSLESTRLWLQWLARQIGIHKLTVFYLEHLQPGWLSPKQRQIYHQLGMLLPAVIMGALVSLLLAQLLLNNLYILKGPGWLLVAIMGGLLGGLFCPAEVSQTTHPVLKPLQRWTAILVPSIGIGGLIGLNQGWGFDSSLSAWLTDGGIYGAFFGLCSSLLLLLQPVFFWRQVARSQPASGWWSMCTTFLRSLHLWRSLLAGLFTGVTFGLSACLSHELSSVPDIVKAGLAFGLECFLTSIVISVIQDLKRLRDGIQLTEHVSWNWRELRDRLFEPAHAGRMLLLTGAIAVLIGLGAILSQAIENLGLIIAARHWPNLGQFALLVPGSATTFGLCFGLSFSFSLGLLWWFLLALYQSITQSRIKDEDRRQPNLGTRRSLRYSLILGPGIGLLIGLMEVFTLSMGYGLNFWLTSNQFSFGLSSGFTFGCSLCLSIVLESTLLFWLITGGLAVWRHTVIRLLLAWAGAFPWNASHFLEDARARILLKRHGGGYSFFHPLLQDFLIKQAVPGSRSPHGVSLTPLHFPASQLQRRIRPGSSLQIVVALLILVIVVGWALAGTSLYQQTSSVTNPYPFPGQHSTLAFFDPLNQELTSQWSSTFVHFNYTCEFIDGSYLVSQRYPEHTTFCYMRRTVSNFIFKVQLTILQGDCGGMVVRDDGYGHFYSLQLCQDGTYAVRKFVEYQRASARTLQTRKSAAIRQGLHQQNTMAVVADGDLLVFYINRQEVYQMRDGSYTTGLLGLIAMTQYFSVTDVAYGNARVWVIM